MLSILIGTITMAAALRMAVPLILSSVGGCFGDRTGIFNIALEALCYVQLFLQLLVHIIQVILILEYYAVFWPVWCVQLYSAHWYFILAPAGW